jgi:hypothetical protein
MSFCASVCGLVVPASVLAFGLLRKGHSGLAPENLTTLAQRGISLLHERGELLGRVAHRNGAFGVQPLEHVGLLQRVARRVAELARHVGRQARGAEQAEPRARLVARQGLGNGRHVGERGQPPGGGDAQRLELAGLDVGLDVAHRREHQLHLARQQVLHGGRGALVGDVDDVHARLHLEGLARHVQRRAHRADGEVQLPRLGLGQRDELAHVLHRQARAGHQDRRRGGHAGERGEVLHRVEGQRGVQRGVDGVAGEAQQQRVAVGRGLGDRVGGDVAARAGLVLDDDGAAQRGTHADGQRARQRVGRAAGGRADEDTHGRVADLRAGTGGKGQCGQCGGRDEDVTAFHRKVSLYFSKGSSGSAGSKPRYARRSSSLPSSASGLPEKRTLPFSST